MTKMCEKLHKNGKDSGISMKNKKESGSGFAQNFQKSYKNKEKVAEFLWIVILDIARYRLWCYDKNVWKIT